MSDTEALADFVSRLANRNSAAPVPHPPVEIMLAEQDEEDLLAGHAGGAEGQSFVIEYVDSQGATSTRRVTVWALGEGAGGIPVLDGFCHERKAERRFRVDRIKACIDYDGTVHSDVPAFLADTFGMDLARARAIAGTVVGAAMADDGDAESDWPRIRALIKPHATLLSALSISDGAMSDREIAIAVEHCATLSEISDDDFAAAHIPKIQAYIRRLRPTQDSLLAACHEIAKSGPAEITDLLIAALALIDVDGVRDPEEIAMIDKLSMELVGKTMT